MAILPRKTRAIAPWPSVLPRRAKVPIITMADILWHYCAPQGKTNKSSHERVASFRSRRRCSLGPRWRATAPYESGALRKMMGLRGHVGGGKTRDRRVFCPYAPDTLASPVSVFSHDFKRFKRFAKLATSSMINPSGVAHRAATRHRG